MFTFMTMNWFNALFVVKAKATAALFLEVLLYEKLLQVLNWRYVLLELYRTNDQFGKFGISFFKLMKRISKKERRVEIAIWNCPAITLILKKLIL